MIIVTAEIWCDARQYDMPNCSDMFRTGLLFDRPLAYLRTAAKEEGRWCDPKSPNYYPRHLCPACRAVLRARERVEQCAMQL